MSAHVIANEAADGVKQSTFWTTLNAIMDCFLGNASE